MSANWEFPNPGKGCRRTALRAAAAVIVLAAALGSAGAASSSPAKVASPMITCAMAPPKFFVARQGDPVIVVLRMTQDICWPSNYPRPVSYIYRLAWQKWVYVRIQGRRVLEAHTVAAFQRTLADLPQPGDSTVFKFPSKVHHENPVKCLTGRYFARWREIITLPNGFHSDTTFFYPYDITRTAFTHPPSPRRSWQVSCRRPGQVPDPPGEP